MQTTQMTQHGQSQTTDITSDSESGIANIQDDESIYEVPEDDYGYLHSSTNESNAYTEDLPFHTVHWMLQYSPSTSKEESSLNICTVCYSNERTHVFLPCSHLACCIECIIRLETNRCPICNETYENYVRVIRS
ncbi:PREDICTED: mitochondrial ubiquitin ligase activator of NFKB 1-like isoform X1 [Vollenhovia emeryi]|uniref:mitochondrial ubiquitin ligase activator of NFKB 1-like isoform X1 n=1 Tax=Vollenhovia emeryi TaxID=411798 RepID=UPI0005F516D3|nr:PREDICTED: mitochondrial ubiquitin ligase activator of NFKB 1-like isoform X1 [Vollenhovia emeryi]